MVRKPNDFEDVECEMSCGNVFVDLEIENPEEELTKTKLAWEIEQLIQKNQ